MSSTSRPVPSPEQTRKDALLVLTALTTLLLFVVVRVATTRPLIAMSAAALTIVLAVTGVFARARLKDGLAGREDPPREGIVIGTVRGNWRLAQPRPYCLGWGAFMQHVLITGPTGRGKSFTFVDPILRAHLRRPDTGVLYLDGKGDRIDTGPRPVRFDHVFCPEDPQASAQWNPLAGPDPAAVARSFADALFPQAGEAEAVFYEARGAHAIRTVIPALALTGPGAIDPDDESEKRATVAELCAHGISEKDARYAVDQEGVEYCRAQMRWYPARTGQDASLLSCIMRRHDPPRAALEADRAQGHTPPPARDTTPEKKKGEEAPRLRLGQWQGEVTIHAVYDTLFRDGRLEKLAQTLEGADPGRIEPVRVRRLAEQLRGLARERPGTLANLENRLSLFLVPPFDELCARSDFAMGDVCAGRSIAMLLPAGSFPGISEPIGRVALAQFKQAVLASTAEVGKVAVLDEFHNFVSADFTAFLSQARSKGGGAVMCTQTIADFDIRYRDELLANASTQIITPGSMPYDAEYWSRAFGELDTPYEVRTTAPRTILDPAPLPAVRHDVRPRARFTPTEISEIPTGKAIIRQVTGRRQLAPVLVDVERAA